METLFAKHVRARMREVGIEQDKGLAVALSERMDLKPDTVISKLSKLLRGDPEARQQLIVRDGRQSAWASVLQVDPAKLTQWLAESDARYSLVVDPRLVPEAGKHIREFDDGIRYSSSPRRWQRERGVSGASVETKRCRPR